MQVLLDRQPAQYLVRQVRKIPAYMQTQSTVEQNPPWAGQQNNPPFIVGLFSLQIGTGADPFIGRLTINIVDKFVNFGLNL